MRLPEFVRSAAAWVRRHPLLMLFLITLIVFNLNGRPIASVDTIGTSRIPFSILEYHDLYMDHYMNYYGNSSLWPGQALFIESQGHYLSGYPLVTPLLVTPLYVVTYVVVKMAGIPIDMTSLAFRGVVIVMEKLSASLLAAAGCVVFYMVARWLFRKDVALLATVIYAFAMETWAISSQGLWQHGVSELSMLLIILVVILNEKKPGMKNYVCLGLLSALYVFNRPLDGLLILPVLAYVLLPPDRDTLRRIACFALPALVISAPFVVYNAYFFGSVLGGYNSMLHGLSLSHLPVGLPGILVSPSRGLFIYTPVALLAIPGVMYIKGFSEPKLRNFFYVSVLSVVLFMLVVGSYFEWWGGGCYGPRYLTDIVPFLAIFIGMFLNKAPTGSGHRILVTAVALLIVLSVLVQVVGVFFYPNGGYTWDDEPGLHDGSLVGDWGDTQIGRSINAGIWNPFAAFGSYFNKTVAAGG